MPAAKAETRVKGAQRRQEKREKDSMSTQPPDNTSATMTPATSSEPSPVLQSADALTASSAAVPSPLHASSPAPSPSAWQRFSERRIAFFARREGLFLWLLGIPMLLAAVYMLMQYLFWTSGQGGLLDSILTRDWQP